MFSGIAIDPFLVGHTPMKVFDVACNIEKGCENYSETPF